MAALTGKGLFIMNPASLVPSNAKESMFYTRLLPNLQPKTRYGRRTLLRGAAALAASSVFGGFASALHADQFRPPVEGPVPAMTSLLLDAEGATFDIPSLSGRSLLVNFWARWCAPCIHELPALARAAAALEKDGVEVLLVSIDRGGAAKALPTLEEYGVSGPRLGFDPKARLSREMAVRGLPTTFLLDADQQRSWTFLGPYEWDSEDMLALVRNLADS